MKTMDKLIAWGQVHKILNLNRFKHLTLPFDKNLP